MNTETIADLFAQVDVSAGLANEHVLRERITDWCGHSDIDKIRELLHRWLESSADIPKIRVSARETSTHYVWPLYWGAAGYGVTLNEFKDPAEIADGYAVTIHNHRYSFVSLILSGGYTQVRSDVELRSPGQAVRIRDLREDAVVAGDILEIAHDEFHRLEAIDPGTVTLVIKCPAVKRESISVNTRTLRVATHLPVEERVGQLMDRLQSTSARRG